MATRGLRGIVAGYPFDGARGPQRLVRSIFAEMLGRNRGPASVIPLASRKFYGDVGPIQIFELPNRINSPDAIDATLGTVRATQKASRRSA